MKKASIYTKTGDHGMTGLVGGTRVYKSDLRIHLYGEVDELNSVLGLAISFLPKEYEHAFLLQIQSALFDLGSNLATEYQLRNQYKIPPIKVEIVSELEKKMDEMDSQLPMLKNFILPGGHSAAAAFHICRTTCRRVERLLVQFENEKSEEKIANAAVFLNRLSDFFFLYARYLNSHMNISETSWIATK